MEDELEAKGISPWDGGPLLRGKRVLLRPFSAGFSTEEVARQRKWDRDEEVLRWSGGRRTGLTLVEYRRMLEQRCHDPFSSRQNFAILNEKGELIGRIGCYNASRAEREAELGIVLGEKEFWGQGYGRDAVITFLKHLFREKSLHRVYLATFSHNIRAQRCFESCGFKKSGTSRDFLLDWGWKEEVLMEVLREDFQVETEDLPQQTSAREDKVDETGGLLLHQGA